MPTEQRFPSNPATGRHRPCHRRKDKGVGEHGDGSCNPGRSSIRRPQQIRSRSSGRPRFCCRLGRDQSAFPWPKALRKSSGLMHSSTSIRTTAFTKSGEPGGQSTGVLQNEMTLTSHDRLAVQLSERAPDTPCGGPNSDAITSATQTSIAGLTDYSAVENSCTARTTQPHARGRQPE